MRQPLRPQILLFDIDGTLVDSAGAGGGALLAALEHCFQVERATPVRLQGRTDLGIMSELLERHQLDPNPHNLRTLCGAYFQRLPKELQRRAGQTLPGVKALLEQLSATGACHLGLLTGNMPASAQAKLEHFGLWAHFEFGIFGDLATQRPQLAQPAWQRIAEHCGDSVQQAQVVVIGDTPLDVELAVAMGVRSLAVCTGGFDADALAAAGASLVVEDLADTRAICDWCFSDQQAVKE